MKYLFFNSRDELLRIDLRHIVYFEGDGNYTTIVTANGPKYSVGMNLSNMEKQLAKNVSQAAARYMRIGKRYIVNVRYIQQVNILKQQLTLTDYDRFTHNLSLSRESLKSIRQLMLDNRL